ncbi:MAG: AAA family ATPase [Coriobacteriia bacterium]|nr:AAA family ATPase [Coriobacteriia bacterium]
MKAPTPERKTLPFDYGYFGLEDPDFLRTNLHVGQWRLSRVEMANWGTFNGYQVLPVDRRGLLITGSSGSGKTTLLDAVTTVLTPPRSRHLNAAARSTSTKGEDRTVYSYIRGAWKHETDESGEIANSYLRARVATWSGILLCFENGAQATGARLENGEQASDVQSKQATIANVMSAKADGKPKNAHEPVNLLVLFHLKAGSNSRDGLSELYAVVHGNHALNEFEPYAINGCDIGKLKRDYKDVAHAFKEHSSFAYQFCRLLGINGPKTLELLHKTQGAKNFGSLDDLFRKFMLDEPQTFEQADEAVEQFSALSQAHNGVVDQRRQMQYLEPLVKHVADYQAALRERDHSERLQKVLDAYVVSLIIQCLLDKQEATYREADRAAQDVQYLKGEFDLAEWELGQAKASMSEAGGHVLDAASLQMLHYEQMLDHIEKNRNKLEVDLTCADITTVPVTFEEWGELVRLIQDQARKTEALQTASKDADYERFGRIDALKKEAGAINRELHHLRSEGTTIPLELHRIREKIAAYVGVFAKDLPFAGELMSVKPEYLQWQGAIERLLGQQAKTLLVANRHAKAVAGFVESEHLGLRFEYDVVPAEVEVPQRSLHALSLVKMVLVKAHKTHPEFSDWLNANLRERFNYVCVTSPAQLQEHAYAITIGGQVKRNNHHIKDDRYRIDDRTQWVLGDNNEDKIEQLIQKAQDNQRALLAAEAVAATITEKARKALNLDRLAHTLTGSDWKSYDKASAQRDLMAAQKHYDQLKRNDKKLDKMKHLCDEAQSRREIANDALQEARVHEKETNNELERIKGEITRNSQRMKTTDVVSDEEQKQLAKLFKRRNASYLENTATINETARYVQTDISDMARKARDTLQKAQAAAERVMHDYKQAWPVKASDLSDDYEDKDGYLEIYQQIRANGLPDYEQRFLRVLHDFSQDQITVISSTIRRAFREMKEKLQPVNRSLKLSHYNPGIYLQIEAKDNRGSQVSDFLSELQAITEGSWSDDDLASAEARYLRIAKVINRFKSGEYADKMWKQACLDTRQHVSFIAKELDEQDNVHNVHGSDAGLSGGQKQKLVVFCLAAALRYQLADEEQPIPRYGTVVLDEAFDKADHSFATTAMEIFRVFGFHMVLATPLKLLQTLEPHIGEIALVDCQDSRYSTLQIVTIENGTTIGGVGYDQYH